MIPREPAITAACDVRIQHKLFWIYVQHGGVVQQLLKVSASTVIMQAKLRIAYQSNLVGFS